MNDTAHIYRAEILRAVFGPAAHVGKVHDIHRLNQLAERLADTEEAQSILRAKGHGSAGQSLLDIVRNVPNEAKGMLRNLFRRSGVQLASDKPVDTYPSLGEVHDIWTAR